MREAAENVVLVPLDGSPQAARAIPLARTVAAQLHARLTALHVAPQISAADMRHALALDQRGLEDVALWVREGNPVDVIVRALQQPEVEVLVLTTLAAGDPERDMGRVVQEVVIHSTRPMICLRPEIGLDPALSAPPLTRLLAPIDGTCETASALRPVTALARRFGASIDVAYIVMPSAGDDERRSMPAPRYVDQPHYEWDNWITEWRQRLLVECAGFSPSAVMDVQVRGGEPGPEIVRLARERHYDAIALVRRSRLEPERARTLRYILRQSPCPIMLVGGEP